MTLELENLQQLAFCDPGGDKAGSSGLRRVRARSAIVVIGVEPQLQRIFTLYTWAQAAATDLLANTIFDTYKRFPKIKQFGIEGNAMQSLFAAMLQREARTRGIKVPFIRRDQDTHVDKDFRIRTALQKPITEGRIFIQDTQIELLNELRSFPTGQTKDLVDALASAVMMVPHRSTQILHTEEEEAVLKYLRDTGAPTAVIESRFPRLRTERMIQNLRDDYRSGKI